MALPTAEFGAMRPHTPIQLQQARMSLPGRIAEMERQMQMQQQQLQLQQPQLQQQLIHMPTAAASRSRSRSPVPKIDPRDLSPPKWTHRDQDDGNTFPRASSSSQVATTASDVSQRPVAGGMPSMCQNGIGPMSMNPMMAMMASMNPIMAGMNPMMAMGMGGMAAMGAAMGTTGMGSMGAMGMMSAMGMPSMGAGIGNAGSMSGMGGIGMMPNMAAMMGMGTSQGQMQTFVGAQQGQEQAYAKAMAVIKAGAAAPTEEEQATGTVGVGTSVPRTDPTHHAYWPANTQPFPGITDRRWEGTIRLFIGDTLHGYGFIKCNELREKYPDKDKDVFLHRNQRAGFKQGDVVNFAVFMNFKGNPQATDLRVPSSIATREDDDE